MHQNTAVFHVVFEPKPGVDLARKKCINPLYFPFLENPLLSSKTAVFFFKEFEMSPKAGVM